MTPYVLQFYFEITKICYGHVTAAIINMSLLSVSTDMPNMAYISYMLAHVKGVKKVRSAIHHQN